METRLNIGCGMTPTPGWRNYDNSPSVRISRSSLFTKLLKGAGLLEGQQRDYIAFCRKHDIRWANAVRSIPEPADSVGVIYSSHMLEHLDRDEAKAFLANAMRALRPGGFIRLALPDLRHHIDDYLSTGDGDRFIANIHVCRPRARGFKAQIRSLLVGERHHLWMYDSASLIRLLEEAGFEDARRRPPGQTGISDPGPLNLREREGESVYVEARKPSALTAIPERAAA